MKFPPLIILYGSMGDKHNAKVQKMIDGRSVCGYRSHAEKFGEIIYMAPQNLSKPWERCITSKAQLALYLEGLPSDCIIWCVKHDKDGRRDDVVRRLNHRSVYYSCCSLDTFNPNCNISLVDTSARIKNKRMKLWVKGKDRGWWYENSPKFFDYCLIGRRADKNEQWFISELTEKVKQKRSIMWIGGEGHKIPKTHHHVATTPFCGPEIVRNGINSCRVGINATEHPCEGFPQSLVEMQICGLPCVYLDTAPWNDLYIGMRGLFWPTPIARSPKEEVVIKAEKFLANIEKINIVSHLTLENSYQSILNALGEA